LDEDELFSVMVVALLPANGCVRSSHTTEKQPVDDIRSALSGGRIPEWFNQVETNMTEEQVTAVMKVQPDKVHSTMWEYTGAFSESEPYPVRDVFRIHVQNGKVTRKERTVSDCIYVVPATD